MQKSYLDYIIEQRRSNLNQTELIMKQLSSLLAIVSMVGIANLSFAAPAANIQQLDWMTGNWAGNLGPNQLEENWIATEGSTLMAAVRMTGADATSMFERRP